MAKSWFKYNGSGSVDDPIYYAIISGSPPCIVPKIHLCAINAHIQFISGTQRPIITPGLQSEINTALMTKVESANVRLEP